MKKAEFRFKILRIRNKLSFMAFIKTMTFHELMLNTILRIIERLEKDGIVLRDP